MNFIRTIHIKYEIDSQPAIVSTYNLLVQDARSKDLFLYCIKDSFVLKEKGTTVGDAALFETDDLNAVMQFVDQFNK